jgi:hypothetical protein
MVIVERTDMPSPKIRISVVDSRLVAEELTEDGAWRLLTAVPSQGGYAEFRLNPGEAVKMAAADVPNVPPSSAESLSPRGIAWPKDTPFRQGAYVRTRLIRTESTDWSPEALRLRRFGVTGVVVDFSDSHGLIFAVQHRDGSIAYYEPQELEVLPAAPQAQTQGDDETLEGHVILGSGTRDQMQLWRYFLQSIGIRVGMRHALPTVHEGVFARALRALWQGRLDGWWELPLLEQKIATAREFRDALLERPDAVARPFAPLDVDPAGGGGHFRVRVRRGCLILQQEMEPSCWTSVASLPAEDGVIDFTLPKPGPTRFGTWDGVKGKES